jgi:branched-chain amino acid transport system ATP-binding protein
MAKPRLLLMDEPSLGLAPLIVKQIFEIIKKINAESKTTIFLVEQNANMALKVADRGYVMETGRVSMADTAENLLANDEVRKAYLGI